MDLFLLKKIIGIALMPTSVISLLLLLSIIFFTRAAKFSKRCLIVATCIWLTASMPIVSDFITYPLEQQYPSYQTTNNKVDYIIILGCGHTTDLTLTSHNQLKVCSLQRLVEGYRIFKQHPNAQLITSGYASHDITSNAEKVKQAAISLGVPANKIMTENFPKDTEEEAQLISPRVKGSNVILVTNADHMPRAMNYFQQQGIYPIPAPTGHWVKNVNGNKGIVDFIPNSQAFRQTTIAWYEYLGLMAQWFKAIFNLS